MPKEDLKDEKAKEKDEKETIEGTEKKVEEKLEELKDAKKETQKTASHAKGPKENIIGDISKPDVRDPDFDIKVWSKSIDEKIDKLLAAQKPPEKAEEKAPEIKQPEPAKKKSWLDVELF